MGVNNVFFGGECIFDIRDSTSNPENTFEGVIGYGADGERFVGTAKTFAAIGVTYPVGSTLTCTNGIKTLTTTSNSGQWLFLLPAAGTWTVTATDGENSASQSVEITTEGQFATVTLLYELILFDGGDNTDVTGGWSSSNTNTNQANITAGDELSLSVAGAGTSYTYRSFFHANNPVDLTDISTLTAAVAAAKAEANQWRFGVKTEISSLVTDFAAEVQFTTAGELSLDVSALSGEYYIGFATSFVGANNRDNTASIASVKALP